MDLKEVLTRLKDIKEERARLDAEECRLSTPSLSDAKEIPLILEYCKEAYHELHPDERPRRSEERRKYLFILLFLFSPKTLAGGKMSNGLRTKIADAMGIEPSNVSHYHSDIWFYYNLYDEFRSDVNIMFENVFNKLRKSK